MSTMQPTGPKSSAPQAAVNPFARALSEARSTQTPDNLPDQNLAKMMGQTGGQFNPFDQANGNLFDQQAFLEKQRQEQQKKARRLELHRQVNPVDAKDVFNAREKQITEELEKTRAELKMLAAEIAAFYKDVDIAVSAPIVNPGQEGTYHRSFFQKLREWIMLLRQKVQSARSWMQQMQTKKKRKKGLMMLGQNLKGSDESTAIWNSMHHEKAFGAQGAG